VSQVRRALADEWLRFRELRLRALEDAPDAFGSTLEREREHGEAEWRAWMTGWDDATAAVSVVEEEGRWVGVAVGVLDGDGVAHLYSMWVEPAARGRGLGHALVDAVAAWVRDETTAEVLDLWVTEGNEAATALYRSSGFVETGERQPLREGSTVAILAMRRPIERA